MSQRLWRKMVLQHMITEKKKVNAVAFCCPGLCDSTCQVNLVGVVVTVCDDLPHFVIVCKQHAT